MDEKDIKGFGWTSFFLVTGTCLFLFSGIMHLLDGMSIRIFILGGIGCVGLGILSLLNEWITQRFLSSKSPNTAQQNQSA
jgi:hypothetical protein